MESNWLTLKHNQNFKKNFIIRAEILSLIRQFFLKNGFLEVETPTIVAEPGMEPYLSPMKTTIFYGSKNLPAYFITSPEYAMKKLLVAGFKKIFQICRSYRNGEVDSLHNPEFTMIEWYRTRADYRNIMDDAEQLIAYIASNLQKRTRANSKFKRQNSKLQFKNLKINYQNQIIDLTPPWPRLTMREAFKKYTDVDLDKILDLKSIASAAKKMGYTVNRSDRFDDIFFKIFLNEIEPRLGRGRPTILMDWPAQMAALSRKKPKNQKYAERFEVYIAGLELGNAFSELTDPKEQKKRLIKEQKLREKMKKEVYNIDKEFIAALKIGMPPSGGIAMGVDRIVMLFTDAKSIDEVLFFPAKQIFNLKS